MPELMVEVLTVLLLLLRLLGLLVRSCTLTAL
jgi:hypothetical protein